MDKKHYLYGNTYVLFTILEDSTDVRADLYNDSEFSCLRYFFAFAEGLSSAQAGHILDASGDDVGDDSVARLMRTSRELLKGGVVEHTYFESGADAIRFRYFCWTDISDAALFRNGELLYGGEFKERLGLKEAKETVEALSPGNQSPKKIDQIKELRSASEKFIETITRLKGLSSEPFAQTQLENITFDYAMSQAEVYVGTDTTAYYYLGESHKVDVKITAVRVNDTWKKIRLEFPDRVIKRESRSFLDERLASWLDGMVSDGSLELLI